MPSLRRSKRNGSVNRSNASSATTSNNNNNNSNTNNSTTSSTNTSNAVERRLLIKPLSSVGDKGEPSHSVSQDAQRVLNLIQDERHLVAYDLFLDLQTRMDKMKHTKEFFENEDKNPNNLNGMSNKSSSPTTDSSNHNKKSSWLKLKRPAAGKTDIKHFDSDDYNKATELLERNKNMYEMLQERAPLFLKARDNMGDTEGWTIAQTLFGVTTYYRREEDGSLSVRIEGELKGIPLFEQIAVLREIDLHCHWAPFVTSSLTLAHLDKLDTVGWFMVGLPNFGIARDGCFRTIGCDSCTEDRSVYLVGRGVEDRQAGEEPDEGAKILSEDPVMKTLRVPPVPTRMGSGRMTIRKFEAKLRVLGTDHCETKILANVDPNLAFLPQSLLEFVMKKLCGFMLNKLQTAAKKIIKDPVRNIHAQRMRDESAFYQQFLLQKFRAVCADLGWDVPTISAFELSQAQQMEAEKLNERRTRRMHSFSYYDESGNAASVGTVSTRSEPAMYHSRHLGDSDDDDSDISSLSGISNKSIWKNNPIAIYLREVEAKTQERKEKAAAEARRKASARLRPRPLPMNKKERLKELKAHKERKQRQRGRSRSGSSDLSVGTLPPLDEHMESHPVPTYNQGEWLPRLWLVFCLVVLLFILLKANEFLPTFSSERFGSFSSLLRDAVTFFYMASCGGLHFVICDLLLVDTFETFEMGMKTGDQVKTFYRGKVRLVTFAISGLLVIISIIKAVTVASLKASLITTMRFFKSLANKYLLGGIDESSFEVDIETIAAEKGQTGEGEDTSIFDRLSSSYDAIVGFMYYVFDMQVKILVHSNPLGRYLKSLIMGFYNAWVSVWMSCGNFAYSLLEAPQNNSSWRDDAVDTLRGLLLYTAVFLLAMLFLLKYLSKSYRHGKYSPAVSTDHLSVDAATSNDTASIPISDGGSLPIPRPERMASPSRSTDSAGRRRLRFRRRRQERLRDDDSE